MKTTFTLVFAVPMAAGIAHQLVVLDRMPTHEEVSRCDVVIANEAYIAKIVKNRYGPYITNYPGFPY